MAQNIITSSADLWHFLKTGAGHDSLFYDAEFLNAEAPYPGLRANLKIDRTNRDFADDLREHNISVERFICAFFKSLQPYAQMMNGLCAFFEKHRVKETNKAARMVFDFDEAGREKLDFNLEYFKEQIKNYETARRMISYYNLNQDNIFEPQAILFRRDFYGDSRDSKVNNWKTEFIHERMSNPDFELPLSGNPALDEPFARLYAIVRDFIAAVLLVGTHPKEVRRELVLRMEGDTADIRGWSPRLLYHGLKDHWPVIMIGGMFKAVETYLTGREALQPGDWKETGEELTGFLDKISEYRPTEVSVLSELTDLLKLPVWEHRYELYAAWVLTLIDESLHNYPAKIYHAEGQENTLLLSFKATHLLDYEINGAVIELWSERKYPAVDPRGEGRKENIQPDYTLSKGNPATESCIAVVEVKQYRRPARRKFEHAVDDYARALPKADIFLVNYGAMSSLISPEALMRTHCFGGIRPDQPEAQDFMQLLREKIKFRSLPPFPHHLLPGSDPVLLLPRIRTVYVDISQSLDTEPYKTCVKQLLEALIVQKYLDRLIAVDTDIRQTWSPVTELSINDLLEQKFYGGTQFAALLPGTRDYLVVTDKDGSQKIQEQGLEDTPVLIFENGAITLIHT